ncbi:hypothetical protein [Vibrio splendidus]|uniref:hypothetical protein n=1 Tax=Vibrio splendidus TaxID=29497 RepID=UPI000C81FE30|nr:hypothetical protein [Vibrio splendidus]PMO71109.1 hypothetical protein BCT03_19765 [Vibrio splendidus]PTO71295.1 hypothetical protein CWN84_24755 [Vibrio splendidus]
MEYNLSPYFKHDKIEAPSFIDLVDVFEDIWLHYHLNPAKILLDHQHCEVAALSLLSTYFESIECYISGRKSEGKSKNFFIQGFCRVFSSNSNGIEAAAGHFYKHVRCGLAHEATLSNKVTFSPSSVHAIYATYRKDNKGNLILNSGVTSIVVNPHLIFSAINDHFRQYVATLRKGADEQVMSNFEKTMTRVLGDQSEELIIGVTEDEFLGKL